jgi:hypothetical protein
MRYVVVMLLLASPAFCGEPVYSWRVRGDDPDRAYLYQDGKQIGGWDYRAKHYRTFDGQNWGAPTGTAPVRPPDQRVLAIPQQISTFIAQQKPMFIPQPTSAPRQYRGPLRGGPGNMMAQIYSDMIMQAFQEIPGAIVNSIGDSIAKGNYQLNFQSSGARSPQQPQGQTAPPGPGQLVPSQLLRWLIPRQ